MANDCMYVYVLGIPAFEVLCISYGSKIIMYICSLYHMSKVLFLTAHYLPYAFDWFICIISIIIIINQDFWVFPEDLERSEPKTPQSAVGSHRLSIRGGKDARCSTFGHFCCLFIQKKPAQTIDKGSQQKSLQSELKP